MKRVYAILDTASEMLFGGLHLFPSDTPAIRFFGDIASDQQTMIARHPKDFALVHVGDVYDNGQWCNEQVEGVTDERGQPVYRQTTLRLVMTGEQWLAAQNPGEQLALKVG